MKKFFKYLATYIFPLLLGSFIFSGALSIYNNYSSLNALIIDNFKSAKKQHISCLRLHNRLFVTEYELAGIYKAMENEFLFLLKKENGNLSFEYQFFVRGLHETQTELENEIKQLNKKLAICYDDSYNTWENLFMLLGSTPFKKYQKIMTERLNTINLIETKKKSILKNDEFDPNFLTKIFRIGFDEALQKYPQDIIKMVKMLNKQRQNLAEKDKKIYEIERKFFIHLKKEALTQINERLNKNLSYFLIYTVF